MKKEVHHKGDINHSLRLEIKDKEKEMKLVIEDIKKAQLEGEELKQHNLDKQRKLQS